MRCSPVVVALVAVVAMAAIACGESEQEPQGLPEPREVLEVSSPDLEDGGEFPVQLTCDGDETSPAIEWSLATNTEEYMILMTDPDAPNETFVHWVLLDLDPERSSVGTGQVPGEATQGENSFGDTGYAGPCPPEGDDAHTYEITVYALNRSLEIPPDADLRELLSHIRCCVQASGTLEASYAR